MLGFRSGSVTLSFGFEAGRFKTRQSLIVTTKDLHDEVRFVTHEAGKLIRKALKIPRPGTPPQREALFQRPKDAPLSEYEQKAKPHNKIVDQYHVLRNHYRTLQEEIPNLKESVRQLKAGHTPAPKMGQD